jgi:uncharacterized protein (DUF885 family)
MQKIIYPLFIIAIIASCKNASQPGSGSTDKAFDSYKQYFIEQLWQMNPNWATEAGYHKYDNMLSVPDGAQRNTQLAFVQNHLESLARYDINTLNDLNKIDFHLIENHLRQSAWEINVLKAWQWDPSSYNVCSIFSFMLGEHYAPLDDRLKNIQLKLQHVPAYYKAAMQNIKDPSIEHTQLSIDQNLGGVAVFEKDLPDSIAQSRLDKATKQKLLQGCKDAAAALHEYAAWLKKLEHKNPRSFRLGKELYPEKFAFEIQSNYTYPQLYDMAMARKGYLHHQMAKLSDQLWTKYFGTKPKPSDTLVMIREMIDVLSTKHTKPELFQQTIEQQIPQLEAFIKEKDLIYLDPSKPLKVRKEPAYMAGVAGASINAPGPYDKNGNTYYNVGSLAGWDKARAESYLREYNDYMLQILNIHEAVPGHYTQLVYSNNSPSIIKSILSNGTMVEGWAVYGELMMLENGYGNNEPEMWLMYYKWNLRTVCNTILDISVHTKDMTREQAIDLLTREAFQQQAEAEGKWKRVNVSNVQLCSYYCGFQEIYDLREAYKQKKGAAFNLKQFHESFLSYGSSPVKYIREMMLK